MDHVCVYCGSSASASSIYSEAAHEFATALVERDIGLVYGGAKDGVMGSLADSMLDAGGDVTGVIPETMLDAEEPHPGLTELLVTDSKDERKQQMTDLADGFVALPGGIGTQEEILQSLGRAKHGEHMDPCGFLNVNGYYDQLIEFFANAAAEGFLSPAQHELIIVTESPDELLDTFGQYESPMS